MITLAEDAQVGQPVTDEIATVARDIDLFSGWLKALPNPDVIFKEQPRRGIRIYRDIARDPHVRSVFQTRRLAVVGREWEVQPASDDAADVTVKDTVLEILNAIPGFERVRYNLLDGLLSGFAVGEVLWGVRQIRNSNFEIRNWVVPLAIKRRGQHRFVFDLEGRPRLLTLANMIEGEELPERKFLLFQYDADDENPYGVGLGQSLYWPWFFKKSGIKFWVVFMDKFAMPTPVGTYPPLTPKDVQDDLLAFLKALQTDQAAKLPNTLDVKYLEANRSSTVSVYDPFVRLMNDEISKAVLGQTATVTGTPGALGAETARAEVREDYVNADADLLDEVITGQLIRWIVDFNFGPDVPAPWFHTKLQAEPDIMDQWRLSFRDGNLQRMGVRIPASYARNTYGIPEPDGEEDVLVPPIQPAAGSGQQADPTAGGLGFSEPDALERIVSEAERRMGVMGGAGEGVRG